MITVSHVQRPLARVFAVLAISIAGLTSTELSIASAAPTPPAVVNCVTLEARMNSWKARAAQYNGEVELLNSRGGGTPAQVAEYNAWKARLVTEADALAAEASACSEKPKFAPNPAHTPGQPGFNRNKTIEPPDSQQVYDRAIRGKNGMWYGIGSNGEIYRFSPDRAGGAHFSGMTGGPKGIKMGDIPVEVRRALGRVR